MGGGKAGLPWRSQQPGLLGSALVLTKIILCAPVCPQQGPRSQKSQHLCFRKLAPPLPERWGGRGREWRGREEGLLYSQPLASY